VRRGGQGGVLDRWQLEEHEQLVKPALAHELLDLGADTRKLRLEVELEVGPLLGVVAVEATGPSLKGPNLRLAGDKLFRSTRSS